MKTPNYLFLLLCAVCIVPHNSFAVATCSRANLTKCLDSACAINIGANPAARCQYCGTSDAGSPSASSSMTSVSVGQSAKNTISAKELKSAPTDPAQRYTWAITQCIKKISGCTPDDVSEAYDKLIEQSCKAAGVNAKMSAVQAAKSKKPTKKQCTDGLTTCMTNKCGDTYTNCKTDADIDNALSECGISNDGCDTYLADIRKTALSTRETALANANQALTNLVKTYQTNRENKRADLVTKCKSQTYLSSCKEELVCPNLTNQCATKNEKTVADQLCKFYDLACQTILYRK